MPASETVLKTVTPLKRPFLTKQVWWWHTPLIPALRRQRQVDLCEIEVSLVYRASSRKNSALNKQTNKAIILTFYSN